ncbi:MAG: radical SAM protein, partial [Nitrospirae bacterium]|nr:radical SAM protein [Nitrospirota bacterium]
SGIDSVVVSIDSGDAKEHDFIRNNDGLFDILIDGITFLKAKRQDKKPIIKATTVLSKISLPKMSQIVSKLTSLTDIVSFQPIVGGYENSPHGQKDNNLKGLNFPHEERLFVEQLLSKFLKTNPSYNTNYYRSIPIFWFEKERLINKIKCWSPFLRLIIMPNGDTLHCMTNSRFNSLGNINEMSLMDVWNSNEMISQREIIRRHKNRCICWTQDASFNALADSIPFVNRMPVFNKRRDSID